MRLTYCVYVIKCLTPNHYYIGSTAQLSHRILAHKKGRGSTFTKKHGFKQLINVIHCSNHKEASIIEKSLTQFYAHKYGKTNVCGYCWTNSIEHHKKDDPVKLPKSFGSVDLGLLCQNRLGPKAHECKFEPSQNMKANGSSVVGKNPIQVRGSLVEAQTEKNPNETLGKSVSISLG
jgi:predicted GIY-YIG superfamily endonuclease